MEWIVEYLVRIIAKDVLNGGVTDALTIRLSHVEIV